ncbi:aryl hydrocarbon receptor-like isoform X1 [Erpetoichthys calabaricus]|uniref:aryl hydrocarbon receptor-like isoform X1 n=1 Tax=Erpetoichthys calabaricus TaxID=27687 RepID=UPI002234E080|nr:aryl hydrocarbon receptor-like isoform X1 [Erpetoichthys calabaricus]
MLGSGGVYASKKRKKPLPKTCTAPRPEGAKSNPSKRHRDRLNCELDKLTSLLPYPEDVRARLDKLSVLRLSVGYLKVKSFFNASWKKNGVGWLPEQHRPFGGIGQNSVQISGVNFSEGELLLQALNGFVLVVTAEGYVFYASPTIQDYLGFHQSDVLHQSVFELIHTDDRAMFRRQLHFALNPDPFKGELGAEGLQDENGPGISSNIVNYDPHQIPPENSSFLERSFYCRFRCLLDNSSGFLALNFQGRLKFLHGQNKMSDDGTRIPSQLALFAVATPLQPPSILEIRTKTFIFQTKHKLDFTPMGCCARGRVVLGFSEAELCMRGTGYQFIHAADMMYCAENHMRMIKSGESGLTVFRLLTKHRGWVWVQANARLVYKGGRPDFIIARQRALTNDEGEEHLRQRSLRLPFSFTTGEAVLYENGLNGELFSVLDKGVRNKKSAASEQKPLDPNSLLGAMMKQDQAIYVSHPSVTPQYSLEKAFKPDGSTMNLTTSGWQPQGQCPPIKEENEAFNMTSALEKLINDSDICNTLKNLEDNTELQQWEDALLKMDINNDLIIELNDILNNDIFSYLEDILFKDTNGMSDSFTQKNDKSVQLDTLRSVQHDSFTQVIPVCLNQNGFATTAKNPSIYSQGSNDMSTAKQGSLNSVLPSAQCQQQSQLLHPTSQVSNGLQTNPVMGGSMPDHFLHTSLPHLSNGVHHKSVSDNTQYHFNPLSAYTTTAQNDTGISTHKPMPQGRSLSLSNEGQQIMTSSCTQNQSCQMSLGAFSGYPKNRTGSTYPMDMELNTCGGQAQMTSDQLMLTGQQDQLTFGHLENSYPECLQQGHSLQNSFERNRSVGQRTGQLPFQMPVNSEHFKKMQNWLHQHQHQAVYNGKPYCMESSPSSHTQSILPSNCSQSQALSALQINPLQNGSFQSTTIGAGIEQAKHMFQASTHMDSMAVPASTSCLYGNSSLLPYNTISGSTTLNCGTRNLPTDKSPLQASCYYQNNSSEHLIEPSVIPQDDISITSLSCHARISPEIQLKEQHFYNCSIPVKQPVRTLEDDGGGLSMPCKSLHNVTAYFMDSEGKTSCCDF